ncbi:MAG: hypothetical protein A2V46_05695 [Bacteroidetes bacterium RBG_19FT_COMBO_42_7]|jgi:ABC-type Na+ efflux pump permease subunit|nr:MAG: hypothetical protein A2Y71_14850 [Bacteroidetes bacterium RBG_13_42_15]OFY74220.1 MAG: hypothetical protein A2V46_05695 [Bacteroidetes bacterium RBG_19FT_COMBO_42_7]
MKNFPVKKLILLFLLLSMAVSVCEAQRYKRSTRNPERILFGKSLNTKNVKYRESRAVVRAKKKQEANQRRQDKEYDAVVKETRKRAVKIQSPEVQARMLENRKEADLKYKEKNKRVSKSSKKAGRKYK